VYNVVLCKLLKLMSDKLATFMNLTAPNLPIQNRKLLGIPRFMVLLP
jgi:hypothetical protein